MPSVRRIQTQMHNQLPLFRARPLMRTPTQHLDRPLCRSLPFLCFSPHFPLAVSCFRPPALSSSAIFYRVARYRRPRVFPALTAIPHSPTSNSKPDVQTKHTVSSFRSRSASSIDVFRLAQPEFKVLILAILACALSSSTLLVTPIAFSRVLDIVSSFRAMEAPPIDALYRALKRLLFCYILGAFFQFAETFTLRMAAERVIISLRRRVFSALVRADIADLDRSPVAEHLSRLSSDTMSLQQVLTDDLSRSLQGLIESTVATVMLFLIAPKLALILTVTLPLSLLAGVLYGNLTSFLARDLTKAMADANTTAGETLVGIRSVKSFTREAFVEHQYELVGDRIVTLASRSAIADGALRSWNRAIFSINTVCILLFGGRDVARNVMSVGSMMAFILYTSNLTAAMNKLSSGVGEVVRSSGAIDRVLDILRRRPLIESPLSGIGTTHTVATSSHADELTDNVVGNTYPNIKGSAVTQLNSHRASFHASIEFRNVSFCYPDSERIVLSNVTLCVQHGGSIAFVGKSGGGKSTAATLLSRFYDPSSGSVSIGGHDLREFDLRTLREKVIGVVEQEPFLIQGTLAENIAFGRENATRDEIQAAAEAAGVLQFAGKFPLGLDSTITKLSGGEKQRVMIARCLVKDPVVLILDEPTSALDRQSEALVNETIDRLMKDTTRTVVLISHRLASVRYCDRIFVFGDGHILEEGTHSELFERHGEYRKLLSAIQT